MTDNYTPTTAGIHDQVELSNEPESEDPGNPLRDSLETSYKEFEDAEAEANKEENNEQTETPSEEPPEDSETEETTEEEKPGDEKEKTKEETAVDPDKETEESVKAEESKETPKEGDSPLEPLEHWSQKDQTMFKTLPREAQDFLMNTHKGMEATHTKRSQEIAPLRKSVEKWDAHIKALGAPAEDIFDRLMTAEQALSRGTEEQKRQMIQSLVQHYGVKLGTEDGDDDPFSGDTVVKTDPAINELREEIRRMQNTQTQSQVEQQETASKQAQEQILLFRNAKDDSGNFVNPFFDQVYNSIYQLAQIDMSNGTEPNIESLYERACWLDPEVRKQILAKEQQVQTEQKTIKEQTEKSKKATTRPGNSIATTVHKELGLRDELVKNYNENS